MKKILITGANSYVGVSVENWLKQWKEEYIVDTVDMISDKWREKSFKGYDVVFHVAGIAHVSTDPSMEELYYKVNRDLTIETAKKAKNEGVDQFIFMSSIIVYGESSKINEIRVITKDTIPEPTNFYGKSKLEAEAGIFKLENSNFKVISIRPPMIYGKGSKGNYIKLSKVARKIPVFPDISNERSMLHIDNLCEFIKIMIDNNEKGVFFPQNNEYVNTSEMVKVIGNIYNKKVMLVKVFNPIINLLSNRIGLINKVFGNLVYEKSLSEYDVDYRVREFRESIYVTEGENI